MPYISICTSEAFVSYKKSGHLHFFLTWIKCLFCTNPFRDSVSSAVFWFGRPLNPLSLISMLQISFWEISKFYLTSEQKVLHHMLQCQWTHSNKIGAQFYIYFNVNCVFKLSWFIMFSAIFKQIQLKDDKGFNGRSNKKTAPDTEGFSVVHTFLLWLFVDLCSQSHRK